MGCSTTNEVEVIKINGAKDSSEPNYSHKKKSSRHRHQEGENASQSSLRNQPGFVPFLQSRNDQYFNFPEVDSDIYVGEGIMKMRGYISNISKEELDKKRNDFWESRIEGKKETWEFLRNICENKEIQQEEIQTYLSAYGIVPYRNCINVTYDNSGGLYEIPNYCIHDPSVYDLPEEHKSKPKKKKIKFIVRKEIDVLQLEFSNYTQVTKIKEYLSSKFPGCNNCPIENIRLFFGGKEMKNDKEIWFYNVEEGSTVLILIKL